MARETERKFLVIPERWNAGDAQGARIRQGYLSVDPSRVVRVRTADARAFITIKGRTTGITRDEFEYPIPVADADYLLDQLCLRPLVEKVRHKVMFGGFTWEIDEFFGDNRGLLLAEVELNSDVEPPIPPWAGTEVSDDPRYFNSNLAQHPYSEWGSARADLRS